MASTCTTEICKLNLGSRSLVSGAEAAVGRVSGDYYSFRNDFDN